MATRPAKPRPAQAQRTQAAKSVQAAKSAQVQAQKAKAQQAKAQPSQPATLTTPPRELRLAAAVQAVEAVGLLVAAGLAAVATADGKSYEWSSGIAL